MTKNKESAFPSQPRRGAGQEKGSKWIEENAEDLLKKWLCVTWILPRAPTAETVSRTGRACKPGLVFGFSAVDQNSDPSVAITVVKSRREDQNFHAELVVWGWIDPLKSEGIAGG